jgi:hypothetical protein
LVDVTVQRTIDRPVSVVSAYVCELRNAVHWMSRVNAARWDGPAGVAKGAKIVYSMTVAKGAEDWVWEVTEYAPGERLEMRTDDGPFPQTIAWSWASDGSGTAMTMQVTGKPSTKDRIRNPLLSRELHTSITEDLGALKGMLEGRPVG